MNQRQKMIDDVINVGGFKESDFIAYIDSIIIYGFDLAFEDFNRFKTRELSGLKPEEYNYDHALNKWAGEYEFRKLNDLTLEKILRNMPLATRKYVEYCDKTDLTILKEFTSVITVSYQLWIDDKFSKEFYN